MISLSDVALFFADQDGGYRLRRAYPYRGENSGPGKDIIGKLDTQTRN